MSAAVLASSNPSNFFKAALGRPVVVRLTSEVDYKGILAVVDGNMNSALEQAEEYVDGQLKGKYGDILIKGSNGTASLA